MVKKYFPFFLLQVAANTLWGWWALPAMNEQGTAFETLEWMGVQVLVPILFLILLARRQRRVFWGTLLYGGLILLFGIGTLGWALIGPATPLSVYVVCILFFVTGFGILFHSLKDLGIGQDKLRRDYVEDP